MTKKLMFSEEDLKRVSEINPIDYFFYLEQKGLVKYDKKSGRDHYFLTDNNKFSVNEKGFYDWKSDQYGQIIKAVMTLEQKSWKESVIFLKEFGNISSQYQKENLSNGVINSISKTIDTPNQQQNSFKNVSEIEPNNPNLLLFFKNKGISIDTITEHTKQVHFEKGDKKYFGLGRKNESGGYDVHNPFMKSKIGASDITLFNNKGQDKIVVVEGLSDALSFIEIAKKQKREQEFTVVSLNSVSNANKFIEKFRNFGGDINLILDGDKAGNDATQQILDALKNAKDYRASFNINEQQFKDLNDFYKYKYIYGQNKPTNQSQSTRISNVEPNGRTVEKQNNNRDNQTSQSEQGRDNSERPSVDSDNVGDGLTTSSELLLGRPRGGQTIPKSMVGTQYTLFSGTEQTLPTSGIQDRRSTDTQSQVRGTQGEKDTQTTPTSQPEQNRDDREVLSTRTRLRTQGTISPNSDKTQRERLQEDEVRAVPTENGTDRTTHSQDTGQRDLSGSSGRDLLGIREQRREIHVPEHRPNNQSAQSTDVSAPQRLDATDIHRDELHSDIKEIIQNKPSNALIKQVVDELTYTDENKAIQIRKDKASEITDDVKTFIAQYKNGGVEKKGRGVLDEYYTNEAITLAVGNLIKDKFADKKTINVLEPSIGTGNFLNAIKNLDVKTNITGFEINATTAKITKILHPDVNVNLRSFETEFITDNGQKKFPERKYDLVIGNPPYGDHRGLYKGLGEEPKIARYEDYFVKRSLDVLKDGGTLAMVLPSSWLNRQKKSKGVLLTDAYRLPNGVFKGTDIGTDIIVLKSNARAFESRDLSKYFEINKDKVLGEQLKKTNRFGREEDYVKGTLEEALQSIEKIESEKTIKNNLTQNVVAKTLFDEVVEDENKLFKNTVAEERDAVVSQSQELKDTLEKVQEAVDTLNNIKFKSFAIIKEIDKLQTLTYQLPQADKTTEELNEISQDAQKIIDSFSKKSTAEYRLQDNPELKKNVLKYMFEKKDQVVDTGLQNSNSISQEQIEAFKDTNYSGVLNNPEKHMKYANWHIDNWYHDFYYAEGDIYEKLEILESRHSKGKIETPQYEKQKALLESVLPKPKALEDIILSPNHEFVHNFQMGAEEKEIQVVTGYSFTGNNRYSMSARPQYATEKQMVNVSLRDKFIDFVRNLPNSAFRGSSSWEVRSYVDNETVTGSDKQYNALVRERRKEVANDLFNKFLKEEISDEVKARIEEEFNRKYNNIHIPDYKQFPLFSRIHQNFKDKPLELSEVQKAGIGRLTTKGVGLLAHEVGFGKTLSGILSMHEAMERGNAKRPLIVVPNDSILKQWVETIFETIPNAKVNVLGNLGKSYDLSNFDNKDGEITLVTYEGFNNIGFKKETSDRLAEKFSYISKKDLSNLSFSERDIEKEVAKTNELKGKFKKGKVYDWEDFGFDHLTFDEVHNANHIVSKVRIEDRRFASDFRNQEQRTSKLGLNTWIASQYIQEQNEGRNVTLLSATPFTNKPLEYYSILSLVANNRLEKSGYFNVNTFFETFMEADNDLEIDAKGDVKFKTNVRRFKNNDLFQQLLSEYIDIKGEEDNPELKRPNRINKEYKIEQNELTKDMYRNLDMQFDDNKEGAILTHIINARKIALSPYLYSGYDGDKPTMEEFVENSPKIKTTMDLIAQNKKDNPNAGQIIYSELGTAEFPKLKDYLISNVGFKPNEVEIITGATPKNKRLDIQERFNDGKIKVIIGSEAIQEGMNLQKNTTDMYLLSLPYNFTSLRQTEGRAWRQGNKWENVRINFMLTNDSIDVFMLQKLQAKQSRYMEAMKNGANIIDVSDVDTQDLKTAIITDPVTRAEIEIELLKKKTIAEKEQYKAELGFISRKFEKYIKDPAYLKVEKINELLDRYTNIKASEEKRAEQTGKTESVAYWQKEIDLLKVQLSKAKDDLKEVATELEKQGVKVNDFKQQEEITQNEIEKLDKYLEEELPFIKDNLVATYRKEKEEQLKNYEKIDFVGLRAEENKTFFKLAPAEDKQKKSDYNLIPKIKIYEQINEDYRKEQKDELHLNNASIEQVEAIFKERLQKNSPVTFAYHNNDTDKSMTIKNNNFLDMAMILLKDEFRKDNNKEQKVHEDIKSLNNLFEQEPKQKSAFRR